MTKHICRVAYPEAVAAVAIGIHHASPADDNDPNWPLPYRPKGQASVLTFWIQIGFVRRGVSICFCNDDYEKRAAAALKRAVTNSKRAAKT